MLSSLSPWNAVSLFMLGAGGLVVDTPSPDALCPPLEQTREPTGTVPTTLTFTTAKQLTWLKVVIDESTGGSNPGLGEIMVGSWPIE